MRTSIIAGVAAGVALGIGGVIATDVATESADAQGGFQVTAAQLKINQNISSAAVRRSNRGLNYLAPIRTQQTDNADDGTDGVTPLANVPGSGDGWTNSQIANEAINSEKIAPGGVTSGDLADNSVQSAKIENNAVTGEKIADGAVSQSKIGADAVSEGKIATGAVSTDKLAVGQKQYWAVVTGFPNAVVQSSHANITASRVNAGNYRVNFGVDVSGCSANAVPYAEFGGGFPGAQTALIIRDSDVQQIQVRTLNPAGATPPAAGQQAESNFMVQVFC